MSGNGLVDAAVDRVRQELPRWLEEMGMSLTNDNGHAAWALGFAARVVRMSPDERRVVESIVAGIEKGREVYGSIDLTSDTRDLESEASDEARDWLIYRAMSRVKETRAVEETRR